MWYGRASWPLRTLVAACLVLSLWIISDNISQCIHCTDDWSDGHYPSDFNELKDCSDHSSTAKQPAVSPRHESFSRRPVISKSPSRPSMRNLPQDYLSMTEESTFCEDRFGISYLETLRNSPTKYCTTDSPSDLTCFHSQTVKGRVDSLCITGNAMFDPSIIKFRLECTLDMLPETNLPFLLPEYGTFPKYMFDTGPRVVMDNWIELNNPVEFNIAETPNYTILVKREGPSNIWHGLLEIFSTSLTLDVLQMSQAPSDSRPHFTPADTFNTQVVLLDDYADGPLYDLWSMFGQRPIRRLKDLNPKTSLENIILPLAGGSNPLWQNDPLREGSSCENSALLRTFSHRVMDHYAIPPQPPRQGVDVRLTFIDRAETRILLNHTAYLEEVKSSFPYVTIQEVDFARIPFKEQLIVLQQTDILVGVHGAGLANAMFLPPRSTVVEVLPAQVEYRTYETLASLSGHSYYSVRCLKESNSTIGIDWHREKVRLDKERFTDVMYVALKAFYNKRLRRDNN